MGSRHTVVSALDEIARYLDLEESNRFRSTAYRKAARSLEKSEADPESLVRSGQLLSVPGIGKGIAPIITELVENDGSAYLQELRGRYPAGVFDLLRVGSLGLKKIIKLHEELGIATLADLERACSEKKLRGVAGFGAKTEETICQELSRLTEAPVRWLLPKALFMAQTLCEVIIERSISRRAEVAGELRRRLETVGEIVLVVETSSWKKAAAKIIELDDLLAEAEAAEQQLTATLHGAPVRICFAPRAAFGSILFAQTGSEEFVAAITARSEIADSPEEEAVFEQAGVRWIPPELRESGSLSVLTRASAKLIDLPDLRGTFHVHTTYSDGAATLEEMLESASRRAFEYVGISDHSKVAGYAGGLSEVRVAQQQRHIESLRAAHPNMKIFKGSEVDILVDGSLDYDAATLSSFDFVVASVHSRFKMQRDEMTARIARALQNPFTTFLGHMSGRKLLVRPPYELDYDTLFEVAAKHGVIIEINGSPSRLDVDWRFMRKALDAGCLLGIHPDAHSTAEYDQLISGVWSARKGGVPRDRVFNSWSLERVEEHLAERRTRRGGA